MEDGATAVGGDRLRLRARGPRCPFNPLDCATVLTVIPTLLVSITLLAPLGNLSAGHDVVINE